MYNQKKQQQLDNSTQESSHPLQHNYGSNSDRLATMFAAMTSQNVQSSGNSSLGSVLATEIQNFGSNFSDFLMGLGADLLSQDEERTATRYNNLRGYRKTSIMRYQQIVGTTVDGIFGPKTAEAIARFQQQNNLTVDGKIGSNTQRALEQQSPEAASNHEAQAPENSPSPHATDQLVDGQLTQNFSISDFKSNDGAKTPEDVIPNLRELAEQLEILKEAFGGAHITISSGYRSENHNHAVGGVSNSQHLYGRAADIKVSGYAPSVVQDKIDHLMNIGKMKHGGLGRYTSFTHYDTRGHRAEWNG